MFKKCVSFVLILFFMTGIFANNTSTVDPDTPVTYSDPIGP
ncbi:hypothetical protein SAMN05421852_1256 [Thermoflavimicrobium dichotomicum]|uniref:Uncharacterized protein n=1 Tax=Thermoflavimicrobium dichotomicum TaxID=46223 RepID=A0A1I3UHE4_9BACL|nr:hypothetical protein SAMN05421852_1256 [Thermoflavimicrobium dichotomicum]